MTITVDEIIKLKNQGIKQFGEHSFWDKGPHEVMDIDDILSRVQKLGVNGAIVLMKGLRQRGELKEPGGEQWDLYKHTEIESVWSAIMCEAEVWDEFMDAIDCSEHVLLHGY